MEFLLKSAYYGVSGVSSLIFAFFFLANLFESQGPNSTLRHKAIFLASGLFAMALLGWSYRLGHFGEHWVFGMLLAMGALLAFALLTVAGIFLFTNVHWQ